MTDVNTRWNLVVSKNTDIALRQFLANEGGGHKGDLSRFVENAVRSRIFLLEASKAKQQNSHLSPTEIDNIISEALDWARSK